MARVYNFSAGPSALPEEVLQQAADEMLDYPGAGMSVMEMSHRSKAFDDIIKGAEAALRELMSIPDNYEVLFLQGGGSSQFAMIPLNFLPEGATADYVNTGAWSNKAIAEAKRYGNVNVVASSKEDNFTYFPKLENLEYTKDAAYLYITNNNTIYGTKVGTLPKVDCPIITDMSSNILSEEINVEDYGMIFAGAQKNIGPAGVVIAIIRKDLIGQARDICPTMFNYEIHANAKSLFNTPPTYGIYIAKLVFERLLRNGGIKAQQELNYKKADLLYNFLDNSEIFKGTAQKESRSIMNVPFVLPTEELNAKFIEEAKAEGMENLKGHRTVGGMRASIYNAMPLEGVQKLVDFMKKFEAENK